MQTFKPSNFNNPFRWNNEKHLPKRNSAARNAEMLLRRQRQLQDVANCYAVVISKYIPAGVHRNVPLTNR